MPFFVKLPGQRRGKVDDRAVRTIDALPTIAEGRASCACRGRTDGMPADERPVDPDARSRRWTTASRATRCRSATARRRCASARPPRRGCCATASTAIGPRPDLIGDPVPGDAPAGDGSATVDDPDAYGDIAADDEDVPVLVTGDVTGLEDDNVIAIGVDGRIEATTRVFPGGDGLEFSAMVRPDSLVAGENAIAVFEVTDQGGLRRIGPE